MRLVSFFHNSISKLMLELNTILGSVYLDTNAHSRSNDYALEVLTLCSSRLSLNYSIHKGVEVLLELSSAEGSLADRAVDDVGLVETVLDLTCLSIGNSLSNIGGNGTCLGVRHKSTGSEDLTETAYNAHHVGGCDNNVEIHPVFLHDLVNEIHTAYELSACTLSSLELILLAEYKDSNALTCTVGEYNCASYLLISVTGVNAQTDMSLDSFVKFCLSALSCEIESLRSIIKLSSVNYLSGVNILLAMFHNLILL